MREALSIEIDTECGGASRYISAALGLRRMVGLHPHNGCCPAAPRRRLRPDFGSNARRRNIARIEQILCAHKPFACAYFINCVFRAHGNVNTIPRDREHFGGARGKVFTIVEERSRCVESCRRLEIDRDANCVILRVLPRGAAVDAEREDLHVEVEAADRAADE